MDQLNIELIIGALDYQQKALENLKRSLINDYNQAIKKAEDENNKKVVSKKGE